MVSAMSCSAERILCTLLMSLMNQILFGETQAVIIFRQLQTVLDKTQIKELHIS